MAFVDFELAWLELKAKLGEKRSWGTDQVLVEMAKLEVRCQLPEGERDFDARPAPPRHVPPTVGPHVAEGDRRADMATH